jgi:hypothetical protein
MVIFSTYVRRSLPFVSRFTSILMLEGNQLRLLNIISLLSVYLSQSKKKWWEFSHGALQLQEAFDKFLLYINRNSRRMHCSEAVLELYLVYDST